MKVPFSVIDNNTIKIYLHFETADGSVSEGIEKLHPGQNFFGITFEQFIADGSGVMEVPDARP